MMRGEGAAIAPLKFKKLGQKSELLGKRQEIISAKQIFWSPITNYLHRKGSKPRNIINI